MSAESWSPPFQMRCALTSSVDDHTNRITERHSPPGRRQAMRLGRFQIAGTLKSSAAAEDLAFRPAIRSALAMGRYCPRSGGRRFP